MNQPKPNRGGPEPLRSILIRVFEDLLENWENRGRSTDPTPGASPPGVRTPGEGEENGEPPA